MKTVSDTNKAVLEMLKDQREANESATTTQAELVEEARELTKKAHKAQVDAVEEAKSASGLSRHTTCAYPHGSRQDRVRVGAEGRQPDEILDFRYSFQSKFA